MFNETILTRNLFNDFLMRTGKKGFFDVQSHQKKRRIMNHLTKHSFVFFSILLAHSYATFFSTAEKKKRKCSVKTKKICTQKNLSCLSRTQPDSEPVIFTIFLSFNAAVIKVTQLLPSLSAERASFFYIKRFVFFLLRLYFFMCDFLWIFWWKFTVNCYELLVKVGVGWGFTVFSPVFHISDSKNSHSSCQSLPN